VNFLSHYYFERYSPHSERILGALLPDLLKNVHKEYNFHPQRHEEILFAHPSTRHISEGWYRHVEVDRLFHNAPFFLDHCHVLRKELEPILTHLPIRASFMAHIAVELLLDHLLIVHSLVNPVRLYEHLGQVKASQIRLYLSVLGIDATEFLEFYEKFIASRYILDYAQIENIAYALFNICKRVWIFSIEDGDYEKLTDCLTRYRDKELGGFRKIFYDIQDNLT